MTRFIPLFAVGLFLFGPSLARADDLDRFFERDKIAAGKLLDTANKAILESLKLERSFPAGAAALLEKSIAELNSTSVLAPEVKGEWLGKLNARLRAVNETVHAMKVAAEIEARRDAEEAIRKFREADLKKGSGVSGTAKAYIGSVKDSVAAADRLRKIREAGTMSVFRDIDATPLAIAGVVEYPKHWDWIVKNRTSPGKPKLHPKEVALLQTLNSTMAADFEMRRFREVLDFIQEKTGLTIFVDKFSLEDVGIDYDDPVNFKIPKATVRTILKKVLADRGLTYIIKEGSLQVLTPAKARDHMAIRTYPVNDLLGNPTGFGPFVDRAVMQQKLVDLRSMIMTAVEPGIWDINGGPATITVHEPTLSLIIRAPAELHYMMGSGSMFR